MPSEVPVAAAYPCAVPDTASPDHSDAHILDDDRRLNAQRFDDFFYRHQGAEPEMPHQTAQSIPENSAVNADAAAALTKFLANPSMAELIKNLAKSL